MEPAGLIWFRKCLRIHDNPSLNHAALNSYKTLYPVFILDPYYLKPDRSVFSAGSGKAGVNRIRFLMESLEDLDASLRKLGSRLVLLKGEPGPVICKLLKDWKIEELCFEEDTEPDGMIRDKQVKDFAIECGVKVFSPVSHTLFNPSEIIKKNGGKVPLTYQSFISLAGNPSDPTIPTYSNLPPVGITGDYEILNVPTLEQLGYKDFDQEEFPPFKGGETEALNRLNKTLENKEWVTKFEKPKTDPSAFLKPATTVLSPYLKFGCLSSRYFYKRVNDIYMNEKKHTKPPVSLIGQLLWRDFFYTVAFGTPNFDKMKGNKICKQISWRENEELFIAWRDGQTGFPWIDSIMIQLKKWGWIHHLARHSVACFLTRGDLFIHWEKGRDIFERLLLDSDWSLNNANWLWLSCSSFFYQYHRIYSPISFGKKYDPNGNYIRHFLPILKDFPKEYIYEPWTAPLSVQKKSNCIIGKDYPKPVVNHEIASKECKEKMEEAYKSQNNSNEKQKNFENNLKTKRKRNK